MTEDKIREVVKEIVKDICDRRGIGHEWHQIDDDIKEEIEAVWFNIILEKVNE